MATQPSLLNLEEFHRLYDGAKPAYEYWHGEAIQKSMPTVLHGLVQLITMMLLRKAGWNTASEVRLKVVSEAEPVPDAIAIRGKFKGRYPSTAPELCVEILSSTDRLVKVIEKATTYLSWGSEFVWIIDPEKRTAWSLSRESAFEPVWIPPSGTLKAGNTLISLQDIFDQVDNDLDHTELE